MKTLIRFLERLTERKVLRKRTKLLYRMDHNTPGGFVSFDVHIIKVNAYSLQQLFDKNLFFLLPFYIFNLEDDFPKTTETRKR